MTTLIVLLLVRCNFVRKIPLCIRDIITKISRYNHNRDIKFNRDISLIAATLLMGRPQNIPLALNVVLIYSIRET